MKKIFIIICLSIIVFAEPTDIKQLYNIKTVKVKKTTYKNIKSFYAITKLNESLVYDVTLRFNGYITKLFANKQMQYIDKGDKLFSIYSKELASIYQDIEISKKYNQNIINNLYKKLILLNAPKSYTNNYTIDINSPITGLILKKNINSGSFLKKGQTALEIASLKKIWVIGKIYQNSLKDINIGQDVNVFIEGIGKFKSKIDYIYPYMDSKSKTIDVRVVLENKNRSIYPNLFAKIEITKNIKDILSLPKSAVLAKGNKKYVFIPNKDGSYEPKEIKAKRLDSNIYQIISGLKDGQTVINNSLFLLDSDAITNGLYDNNDEDW